MYSKMILVAVFLCGVASYVAQAPAQQFEVPASVSLQGGSLYAASVAADVALLKVMVLGAIVIAIAILVLLLFHVFYRKRSGEEIVSGLSVRDAQKISDNQREVIVKRIDQIRTELALEVGKRLSGLEGKFDASTRTVDEAVRKLESVTGSVASNSQSLQQRLEAVDQKASQLEKEKKLIEAAKHDLALREQQVDERESRHKEECLGFAREKEREAQRRADEQLTIERSRAELHSQEQTLQQRLEAVAQEKDELSLLKSKVDESKQRYVQLASEFWPAVFVDGPLSQWRSRIEERLNQPESVAKQLWLAIGKFEAHLLKKEARELPRALVDLGKNAYRFWAEIGLDAAAQSKAAQEWAAVLESETGGNYRLRIAEPGLPKDPAWMAFGMMAGNSSVHEVQGWCVLDSKNFPVEKANVA